MKQKRFLIYVLLFIVFPKLSFANLKEEISFGNHNDQSIVAKKIIVLDDALNQRIAEIGNKIVKVSRRPNMKYTFRIVNSPVINAFATSGGFIYINSGLLDFLESPDELAAILAHEVSHVSEAHILKQIHSDNQKIIAGEIGASLLGTILGTTLSTAFGSPYYAQNFQQWMNDLGMRVGNEIAFTFVNVAILGYKKELETEADLYAVEYLQKANYDPYALVRVFKKLKNFSNSFGIDNTPYLSALINKKPGLDERIKMVTKTISK
jgi:predicted Zn-dependent protease